MENEIYELDDILNSFIAYTKSLTIDWESKPHADKWSSKEVIGHLCDSAQINLQRFIRCTYESGFKLIYHQDEWVDVQRYRDAPPDDVLTLWLLLNKQISRVWKNYPAERLQAKCDNSREGVSLHAVEELVIDYIVHLKHHLQQVTG